MSADQGQRRAYLVTIIFAVPILALSGLGFAAKFIEFVHTFQGESEGAFAITPMVNYLLASAGFFCLLIWATMNGMFRDIEQPKLTMLEHEAELDRSQRNVRSTRGEQNSESPTSGARPGYQKG